jgi:hypothetical protein
MKTEKNTILDQLLICLQNADKEARSLRIKAGIAKSKTENSKGGDQV